jgi:hypothetical protein
MAEDYGAFLIRQMGEDIANSIRQSFQMKAEEKKYSQTSLQKMRDFMSLPPSKRSQLLQDPNFRKQIIDAMDPHLYSRHKEKKEGPQPTMESLMELAKPTPEEITSSSILSEQLQEAKLKTQQGEQKLRSDKSAAEMAELKEGIATGKVPATPLNVLYTGDVKDPLAAALFSQVDPKTLTDLALFEKKSGPMYEKAQQAEWFKWGMTEGFSPGMAMRYAISISQGKWEDVPLIDPLTKKPVRGKAEQELATSAMNAQTSRMNAQNTREDSIATAAVNLAEKSGLSLDQARANVMAMRNGQPQPFPTPHFSWMAGFDEVIKQQEIKKHSETILNDRAGISTIRESISTLMQQYKEGIGDTKQLETDIAFLHKQLTERMAQRYGMKFEEAGPGFWGGVGNAMAATWDTMKTSGAWSDDVSKDVGEMFHALGRASVEGIVVGLGSLSDPAGAQALKEQFARESTLSEDQEKTLLQLYENADKQLKDPNTPAATKKKVADYVRDVLEVVRKDPRRFDRIYAPVEP